MTDDRVDSGVGALLVHALWVELYERYGEPDAEPDPMTAELLAPAAGGSFFVAWEDGEPVGCGALRRYDDDGTGEVKRMYVVPAARGRGISRIVLEAIELRARTLGYARLVLETGTEQPEAIGLYRSHGYDSIEPYGFYAHSPLSRCFAKHLT